MFILGPSGQGKTSFFLAIFQEIFVSGKLIWNQKNLLEQNKKAKKNFAKLISYLSQDPTSINFQTVYTNLAKNLPNYKNFFYNFFTIPTNEQKEEIFDILANLGLENHAFFAFQDLSGGQQQRVEIAKLMLQKPKIILADEPTSALDPKNSKKIIDLIINFAKKNNSICLIVTHNLDLIKKYKGKILIINEGKGDFYESFTKIEQEKIKLISGESNAE